MSEELAKIDANYREEKAKIRAFEDLTYEAKERKVRALGLEHAGKRKEAEKAIADRLKSEEEAAFRKAFGPAPSTLSAEQQVARELRLQRLRAEAIADFDGGHQDPLINYERAIRAGDTERAEVIGKVGPKYLTNPSRRQRLSQLVSENEPADRRRAKETLARVEGQKRTHELGTALNRLARAKGGSNA